MEPSIRRFFSRSRVRLFFNYTEEEGVSFSYNVAQMPKRGSGKTQLSPAWWIAYGVLCGLAAAGLILLLASPRRGKPIELLPAPTSVFAEELESEVVNSPEPPTSMPVSIFPININSATLEELEQLPNIGPVIAQAIISYREAHGDFTSLEDLQNVSGIGPKTYEAIEPLISLESP